MTALLAWEVFGGLPGTQLGVLHSMIFRSVFIFVISCYGIMGLIIAFVISVVLKRHIEGLINMKLRVTGNLPFLNTQIHIVEIHGRLLFPRGTLLRTRDTKWLLTF